MEQYIDFIKIEPCDPDGAVSSHVGTTPEGAEYLIPDELYNTRSRNLWSHPNREQAMLKAWDSDSLIDNV
jgi:hypothetical protein